jgi:ribosome-binding protein aMBF1 (putative translation factor)
MLRQFVQRNGKRYALVEPAELRRLERLAAEAEKRELPPWPPADAQGNRPAIAFARVSIARKIVEQRRALGISQQELARLAGLRQETISRLESGKHSPTIRTVEKIDKALKVAERRQLAAGARAKSATRRGRK